MKFTATARGLGIFSATATVILLVAYTVTLVVGLASLESPHEPIGDAMFTILSLLWAGVPAPLFIRVRRRSDLGRFRRLSAGHYTLLQRCFSTWEGAEMRNKVCAGLLATMAAGYLLRREGLRWGATDEEVHKPLPGDEVVPHPMLETTHAASIDAPAEEIWPWLVQMGYYRAGWYMDPSW